MYASAVSLMHDHPLPARVRLVSHCVRDIANRLPEAVGNRLIASRVDYTSLAGKITATWPRPVVQHRQAETPEVPPEVSIPGAAYVAIDQLVRAHLAGNQR